MGNIQWNPIKKKEPPVFSWWSRDFLFFSLNQWKQVLNQRLILEKTPEFINVPIKKLPLDKKNLSVSLWFKIPKQYNHSSLYFIRNGDFIDDGFSLWIDQNNSVYGVNQYAVGMYLPKGINKLSAYDRQAMFITNQKTVQEWNNLIATYDGSILKLYLNILLACLNIYIQGIECNCIFL